MSAERNKPGYWSAVLHNKCPRCREGDIYLENNPYKLKTCVKMHRQCTHCNQPTEIEVGFYYGTGYVSYVLAVVVCAVSFVIWYLTVGFSLKDSRFFWWLGSNAVLLLVLQPYLMRLSRTLWLSWFVSYDPNWREHPIDPEAFADRIVKEEMGNW